MKNLIFKGGSSQKTDIEGGLPKKGGLGQFADLKAGEGGGGGLARKMFRQTIVAKISGQKYQTEENWKKRRKL